MLTGALHKPAGVCCTSLIVTSKSLVLKRRHWLGHKKEKEKITKGLGDIIAQYTQYLPFFSINLKYLVHRLQIYRIFHY